MVDGRTRLGFEVTFEVTFEVAFEVAFGLDVAFDFDFGSSHVSTPFVLYRKWKEKSRCLRCSRGFVQQAARLRNGNRLQAIVRPARVASFGSSHFLYCTNGDPAGATTPGSPFWHNFLAKQKGV
ncbi:MAG: hypothetical protein V4495_12400 [Pseudomonadota bacterium]